VRCPGGSERLEFHDPGETHLYPHSYEGQPTPCTARLGEEWFFLVKAVCAECRREQVLHDLQFHGCNGFLNPEAKERALPRPRLWPWRGLMCGSAVHNGEVLVIQDYKDRYFEYGEAEKFGADHWVDAFGCLAIGIKCCGCGHETPCWVDCGAR